MEFIWKCISRKIMTPVLFSLRSSCRHIELLNVDDIVENYGVVTACISQARNSRIKHR